MERRFEGKVALVTGAAGGIGGATATRFGREGASLVLVDLPGTGLEEIEGALAEEGAETLVAGPMSATRRRYRATSTPRSSASAASTASTTTQASRASSRRSSTTPRTSTTR